MSFYSIKISEIKSRKKGKKLCVKTFSKRLRENLGKKGKKKIYHKKYIVFIFSIFCLSIKNRLDFSMS